MLNSWGVLNLQALGWLILLPICNYEACFFLHWGFSLKQRGQSRNKRDSSVEPWTRATKPTCLFPPSNKGVGTTHPNYISATCHEWYSWVAKINHIQKPVPGCSDPIPSAHLLLQRRLTQSNCCWMSQIRPQLSSEQEHLLWHTTIYEWTEALATVFPLYLALESLSFVLFMTDIPYCRDKRCSMLLEQVLKKHKWWNSHQKHWKHHGDVCICSGKIWRTSSRQKHLSDWN